MTDLIMFDWFFFVVVVIIFIGLFDFIDLEIHLEKGFLCISLCLISFVNILIGIV